MKKRYLQKSVYDAALERIEIAFNDFDQVLVALSGGKDSGVCVNLCYDYAKRNGLLGKLAIYHQDYEAGYPYTFEFIERMFDYMSDIKRYWLCLPITAACSVSMFQTEWIPWDPDQKDIWVRSMPDRDYVVHEKNVWFPFQKGIKGFDMRIEFAKAFAEKYGKTAVIVGLRADESLSRQAVITSQHRRNMYKKHPYTFAGAPSVVNFYPIYDWRVDDIWIANARFEWDYNRLYDLYYQAGLSIHEMRTASPFHPSGQKNLGLYRAVCPHIWGKMVSRVNGVNFGAIYGGTSAMGWNRITKPSHFTWEQYARFLIDTLPEKTRSFFLSNINRIMDDWENKGHGRNPDVIATMQKEGIEVEKTGVECNLCTKDNYYEIVKIKSGMPEETSITPFRKCPSWKGVCTTILKNDFTCQYMGVGRSKKLMARRKAAIARYKNI